MSNLFEKDEVQAAIEDFKRPKTFKKSDLLSVEENIKKAMQEVGFNLKYVKDNP